jgi:hypothetical protein
MCLTYSLSNKKGGDLTANVAEFRAEAVARGILRAGLGDEERATIVIFKLAT